MVTPGRFWAWARARLRGPGPAGPSAWCRCRWPGGRFWVRARGAVGLVSGPVARAASGFAAPAPATGGARAGPVRGSGPVRQPASIRIRVRLPGRRGAVLAIVRPARVRHGDAAGRPGGLRAAARGRSAAANPAASPAPGSIPGSVRGRGTWPSSRRRDPLPRVRAVTRAGRTVSGPALGVRRGHLVRVGVRRAADRGSVSGPLRSDQPPGESQPPGSGESQPLVAGELQPVVAGESQLLVVAELIHRSPGLGGRDVSGGIAHREGRVLRLVIPGVAVAGIAVPAVAVPGVRGPLVRIAPVAVAGVRVVPGGPPRAGVTPAP